jgi:hypothetical protein
VPAVEGHGDAHSQSDQGQSATADHAGHSGHGHAGHADGPSSSAKNDISWREIGILIPIALAIVILGVKPGLVVDPMRRQIEDIRTSTVPASVVTGAGDAREKPAPPVTLHDGTPPFPVVH